MLKKLLKTSQLFSRSRCGLWIISQKHSSFFHYAHRFILLLKKREYFIFYILSPALSFPHINHSLHFPFSFYQNPFFYPLYPSLASAPPFCYGRVFLFFPTALLNSSKRKLRSKGFFLDPVMQSWLNIIIH